MIAEGLPLRDFLVVRTAAQGCLKCKTLPLLHTGFYLLKHETPGMNRCNLRSERRKPGCYKIGVDKVRAPSLVGKILFGKCGLPHTIRTCNDNNLKFVFHTTISPLINRSVLSYSIRQIL